LHEIGKSYAPDWSGAPPHRAVKLARGVLRQRCLALKKGETMSISLILLIVLILLLVGALPSWPYSSGWGYWPSGGLGLVLLILIILLLMGRI
jgi:peptidoglycan/LPS O-acetylase OafA/YrhL